MLYGPVYVCMYVYKYTYVLYCGRGIRANNDGAGADFGAKGGNYYYRVCSDLRAFSTVGRINNITVVAERGDRSAVTRVQRRVVNPLQRHTVKEERTPARNRARPTAERVRNGCRFNLRPFRAHHLRASRLTSFTGTEKVRSDVVPNNFKLNV